MDTSEGIIPRGWLSPARAGHGRAFGRQAYGLGAEGVGAGGPQRLDYRSRECRAARSRPPRPEISLCGAVLFLSSVPSFPSLARTSSLSRRARVSLPGVGGWGHQISFPTVFVPSLPSPRNPGMHMQTSPESPNSARRRLHMQRKWNTLTPSLWSDGVPFSAPRISRPFPSGSWSVRTCVVVW